MNWEQAWDLSKLTPKQREITVAALDACDYDFAKLQPGLRNDVNKEKIPVEWVDLSRYARSASRSAEEHDHDDHPHTKENGHIHVEEDGKTIAHGIMYRKRVLGLAWYSGKVSVDVSLETDPELGKEVFLAEGAHMIDFFAMTPEQRAAIFASYQKENPTEVDANDGWFEEKGDEDYWDWAGEAFMIGFIRAFAPSIPTKLDNFTHKSTPAVVSEIRRLLRLRTGSGVFSGPRSKVYHDVHKGVKRAREFASSLAAQEAGLRPCGVCKPDA